MDPCLSCIFRVQNGLGHHDVNLARDECVHPEFARNMRACPVIASYRIKTEWGLSDPITRCETCTHCGQSIELTDCGYRIVVECSVWDRLEDKIAVARQRDCPMYTEVRE